MYISSREPNTNLKRKLNIIEILLNDNPVILDYWLLMIKEKFLG